MLKSIGNLLNSILRDLVFLVLTFTVASAAGAAVCWWYGYPVALGLIAGILVLGLTLAIKTDSPWD